MNNKMFTFYMISMAISLAISMVSGALGWLMFAAAHFVPVIATQAKAHVKR